MRCSRRPHLPTAAVGSTGSSTTRRGQQPLQDMHIHKIFKRMEKSHGGPPPPGWMPPHMMTKPHGMWHHTLPQPHQIWPPHKLQKMGHHKMHHKMHKIHHKMLKMQHKIHGRHHHKKHHGGSSSSSSSSSSESEDETLAVGIDKVQIGETQNKDNPGKEPQTAPPPAEGGEVCKEKLKCKKDKRFKSKEKKEKCKHCFKKMHKDAFCPSWMQCETMGKPSCRDSRYNKGIFTLSPPEPGPQAEEARAESGRDAPEESQRIGGERPGRRGPRRGDSIDYFMQSVAEQLKKLPEPKIAEAKLKILEVVNDMLLDRVPELSVPVEMVEGNQPQPEAQT